MSCNKLLPALFFSLLLSQPLLAAETTTTEKKQDKTLAKQGLEYWRQGDFVTAIGTLTQSDAEGDIQGTIGLWQLYHFSSEYELALPLLEKAAAANDPESMLELSFYYLKGFGMENPNIDKSRQLLDRSVDLQYQPALFKKAEAIATGILGYKQDLSLSLQLKTELAEAGYKPAQANLIRLYRKGESGVDVDTEKAIYWEEKLKKATSNPEENQNEQH